MFLKLGSFGSNLTPWNCSNWFLMYEAFCLPQYFGFVFVSSCVLCFGFWIVFFGCPAAAGCASAFASGAGSDDEVAPPSWHVPVCSGGGDNFENLQDYLFLFCPSSCLRSCFCFRLCFLLWRCFYQHYFVASSGFSFGFMITILWFTSFIYWVSESWRWWFS